MDHAPGSLPSNTTIIPPKGWTTDKEKIDYGKEMAKAYGLKSPQPIMGGTPESGNCMSMVQSGSKYYLSDPIEGAIWEIVTPTDLGDIIMQMGKPGLGSLNTALVHQMSTFG